MFVFKSLFPKAQFPYKYNRESSDTATGIAAFNPSHRLISSQTKTLKKTYKRQTSVGLCPLSFSLLHETTWNIRRELLTVNI